MRGSVAIKRILRFTTASMAVVACLYTNGQAPGGVSASLTGWFKANTITAANLVLNGTGVSQWKSETGTYTVSQTNISSQPTFVNTAGTANLFNFNPSLQFQVSASKSLNNVNSSPDLLGTNGTVFTVVNTNDYNNNSSSCFAYTANSSNRYQVKAHFRIQTGNGGTGYTADFVPQFPATYGDAAGRILTCSGTGTGFYSKRNGEKFSINNTAALYNPSVSTGLCIGSNNNGGGGEYSNSAIAEVITYNTQLSDADINKVESYLAIKYGITLQSPIGPINYTSTLGSTVWNATLNAGYNNNITGIGRDDASSLMQKQSRSVNDKGLVYIYNDDTNGSFPEMNVDNTATINSDHDFFLIGDNNLDTSMQQCVQNGRLLRMNRIWRVQRDGMNNGVTLAVNASEVPVGTKNILISSDPAFTPGPLTSVYPLQLSGGKFYYHAFINSFSYFSFTTDSIRVAFTATQPNCSNPAGGVLSAQVTGISPNQSYIWNTTPVLTGTTASGLAAGSYTFTVVYASGSCTVSFPAGTIQAVSAITTTVSATPQTICQGENASLSVTATGGGGNYTYNWLPGNQTTASIIVSPTDTTKYIVTVQSGTCNKADSVTVNVKPKPTALFTALPAAICLGDTNTITYTGTAAPAATFNWNGFAGGTILSGSGAGPYTIKFAAAGSYTLQLQVTQNGCNSGAEHQTVIVQASPTASITAAPASICSGDTVAVSFTGNAPATSTYAWNWGGGTVLSGSSAGPYQVRFSSSSTIGLAVTNGFCSAIAPPQPVAVTQKPVALFSLSDSTGCDTLVVRFANPSQNGTGWLWNLGDGTTSTDSLPIPRGYGIGTYLVTLLATNGECSITSAPRIIRVTAGPVAAFGSAPAAGLPIQLSSALFNFTNLSTGATRYLWSFGDNATSTSTSPMHTYNAVGSYTVTLIAYNELGCADTADHSPYLVVADSLLRIPNAFSPNGDGINDTWVITGLRGYPTSRMNVYNRWGQQVYTSTGYATPWDGNYNGKPLPIGTYYYTIVANAKNYNGPITILR